LRSGGHHACCANEQQGTQENPVLSHFFCFFWLIKMLRAFPFGENARRVPVNSPHKKNRSMQKNMLRLYLKIEIYLL
jgi:hypothetical protein